MCAKINKGKPLVFCEKNIQNNKVEVLNAWRYLRLLILRYLQTQLLWFGLTTVMNPSYSLVASFMYPQFGQLFLLKKSDVCNRWQPVHATSFFFASGTLYDVFILNKTRVLLLLLLLFLFSFFFFDFIILKTL